MCKAKKGRLVVLNEKKRKIGGLKRQHRWLFYTTAMAFSERFFSEIMVAWKMMIKHFVFAE